MYLPRRLVSGRPLIRVIRTRLAVLALLAAPLSAADVALRISSETAPPGGWAQIKVSQETLQQITTGRIVMHFDPLVFGDIAAVAVFSAQGDAMGIATVSGPTLDVSFRSTAGGIGQLSHLPILTVTLPVLANAPVGTISAITLDASRGRWADVENNAYSVTAAPGAVTVGGALSIRNLAPGGGLLPAGTVVRVNGKGFTSSTILTIDGVSIANVQYLSAGEVDLTLGGPTELTGKRVVARNPDGAQTEYFAAMPSVPDQSPASFAGVQPLLSPQTWTAASMTFTERGGFIALQNPNPTPVDVILQTPTVFSSLGGQTSVTVPPGALNLYPAGVGSSVGFRAFATLPVRMLALGNPPPNSGLIISAPLPAVPPVQQLTASPAAVSFQWRTGTPAPTPAIVTLSPTPNNAAFAFRVTPPAAPFSATPAQGASGSTLTVSVSPAGLSAGTYSGAIVVTPEGPNAVPTTIPLSLTVDGAPALSISPGKLTFLGPEDYSQLLTVASTGNPIAFTVAAADGSVPHWLTVSASAGTTPAQLSVSVHSTNLNEGVYSAQIVFTGPNNSVTVPVDLKVSASNIFSFSPPSATFSAQTGSNPPASQTVLVYGPSSGAAFSVSTDSGGPWLTAALTPSGQLGAVVTVNPAGLKTGTYTGRVTLTSPASSLPIAFPVTLVLWDQEPALTVTPSSIIVTTPLPLDPTPLTPQSLLVTSGGVPVNFTVSGMPGIFATPASIPAYAGNRGALGSYEYDIIILSGSQKVVVPVTTIVTTSALAPPMIGSVVSAASQMPGAVSPGEIVTIYGFGAGPSNPAGFTLDPSGKVAAGLNGAQVLFDGRPAPMIYGSASQANVIVPYEVAGRPTTAITLQYGGISSGAWAVPVAPSSPAAFTLNASGSGPAAVLNQDNSVNSASNPALRGTVIQIYATGEGQTSPPGVTASVIGTDWKTPLGAVKITIGDQDAVVQYAGSAGNSVAGLFQINAIVPPSVVAGTAVPIAISVGGVLSPPGATVAIQ